MKDSSLNRRKFLQNTAAATGLAFLSSLPKRAAASISQQSVDGFPDFHIAKPVETRIRFSVISINHGHIYGMIDAVTRGGGQLVAFYAKEADLVAEFSKRFPQAKLASSEKEILEDPSIQLILSSAIPVERAPLGI